MRAARAWFALGLLCVAAGGVRADDEPERVTWGTRLSDVTVYERAKWSGALDAPELGEPHHRAFTISGSDIRARQYAPVDPRRGDLPMLLAFRLPPDGGARGDVELELRLRKHAPLRVEGVIEVLPASADGTLPLVGTYTLESRRRPGRDDTHRIRDGRATTRAWFDPGRGVVTRARIELAYELENLDAKRGEKRNAVTQRFAWTLTRHMPARFEGHHEEIAEAIRRGVAWLRENRRTEDPAKGLWKPHGGHRIGTTALGVLTLAACEVPRDDPLIEEGLAWIFERTPAKTYDRAVALMAIDEAYAPLGERARLAAGGEAAERDVPEARLRWVHDVAAELEKTNTSPGSWGYPPQGRVIPNLDTSNTQYAILGLHAATHMGYEPEESTWLGVLRHFAMVRQKDPERGSVALVRDGEAIPDESRTTLDPIPVKEAAGFRYTTMKGPNEVWASMTCAGIASLSIARHHLRRIGSRKLTGSVDAEIEEGILGAWAWIDARWATDRHPHHPGNDWYYYFLYSLERAGILHGVKRVGGHDWYFEGAAQLLARQKEDGGWGRGKESGAVRTCLALLFLKRATAPLTGR